jgi:cytochrome c553
MSALTDRLSDDDLRELAALLRRTHARAAAKRERLERERAEREKQAAAEQARGRVTQ